jgi:pimeloyl-ACP methyl ester carboxylesterase
MTRHRGVFDGGRRARRPGPAPSSAGRGSAAGVRLLVAACISAAAAGAAPESAVAEVEAARLVLRDCRLEGLPTPALCGVLPRPVDPARPDGPTLDLHVAVVPALARHKRADPVLFLAGGPGQSAIELAGPVANLLNRLLNRRDLVLVDQRGTGRSQALACPGDGDDGPARSLASEFDPERRVGELAACRAQLAARFGDLRPYTTPIAAADLEAVRRSLGITRWNVVGASYGTRLALELLRQAPGPVRRVVLDGVVPPDMALPQAAALDHQAALDAVWRACEADPACAQRHPRLRERWQGLLRALPQPVELAHPRTGVVERLVLTRETVLSLVRPTLYSPVLAAGLPAALDDAAAGRWSGLVGLASAAGFGGRGASVASGQHFAVVCSEDLPAGGPPPSSAEAVRLEFAGTVDRLYERVCADWPRARLPDGFRDVPPSPVPVLALSGAVDPVTPPRHGERVVRSLGGSARHVVVPQAGHGTLAIPCLRDVVFRFIDADSAPAALAVESACAADHPRPPAFVPPR